MIKKLFFLALLGVGFCWIPLSAQEGFAPTEHDEAEWEEDFEEYEDDEEYEVPEPTQREILNFLSQHLPEALPLLERVREEESFRDYQEVLERAAEVYIDYHMAMREGERDEAILMLDMQRAELMIEQAAVAWHESESREERVRSREQLTAAATDLIDLEIKAMRSELSFLERETRQIERELAQLENNRQSLIEELVREFTEE